MVAFRSHQRKRILQLPLIKSACCLLAFCQPQPLVIGAFSGPNFSTGPRSLARCNKGAVAKLVHDTLQGNSCRFTRLHDLQQPSILMIGHVSYTPY